MNQINHEGYEVHEEKYQNNKKGHPQFYPP